MQKCSSETAQAANLLYGNGTGWPNAGICSVEQVIPSTLRAAVKRRCHLMAIMRASVFQRHQASLGAVCQLRGIRSAYLDGHTTMATAFQYALGCFIE